MNEYNLLSPEKVYLRFKLAGIGSRFVACFIDNIFQGILMGFVIAFSGIGAVFFQKAKNIAANPADVPGGWLIAIIVLVIFVIYYGYFIFFETIWNGQTPGKRFLKLRAIQENGSSVTFVMVLIRNLLRVIDTLPSMYAIGIIAVLISKKNQRLGDMAAGTIVVREDGGNVPAAVNFAVSETPWSGAAGLHLHNISEADFAVLKNYLLRRNTLKQEEALALEQKLVFAFSQKLGLKPEETGSPAEFLQQVAAMYQNRR